MELAGERATTENGDPTARGFHLSAAYRPRRDHAIPRRFGWRLVSQKDCQRVARTVQQSLVSLSRPVDGELVRH